MVRNVEIHDVPDDLYRRLEARAAALGMTLSEFLLSEARRIAEKPSLPEMRERLARRPPASTKTSAAKVVRSLRGRM